MPGRGNGPRLESGKHAIGHPSPQLVPMVQHLPPRGAAVEVERSLGGCERCNVRRRKEPLVRLNVIQPGQAANLRVFGMSLPNLREECPQLRPALVHVAASKGAAVSMALIGHEVKPQHFIGPGRVIGEAPERRQARSGRRVVCGSCEGQEVAMLRTGTNVGQERSPGVIAG